MKRNVQLTLLLVGGVALCLVIGGTLWWQHVKSGLLEQFTAGRAMGVTLSDRACEDSALARLVPRDRSATRALKARLVLAGCFSASRATDSLCVNVPPNDVTNAAGWAVRQCEALNEVGDLACVGLFQEIVTQCSRRGGA